MKTRILIVIFGFLGIFGIDNTLNAQSKAQTQATIDTLLPSSVVNKITALRIRTALTHVLNYADPTNFAVGSVSLNKLAQNGATLNQVIKWNGSQWTIGDDVVGVSGSGTWGGISGTLSNQADLQSAFNLKAPLANPTFTGTVGGINKSMVGLGNVDNTADASKPISTATQTALDLKAPLANPTFTGTVSGITKSMVGLGNVDNTSDASKPISAVTQSALDLKAPISSPTFTGTVNGITKGMVGLGNVDNTSDASKPISTATQTALDLKAPLANPTFTGTVSGITKSMVGLGSVDNTSDASKPISTATQTALDLKAPLANPTFTGTVNGITKSMVGLGSVDNTSDASKPISTATQTALDLKAPLANPTFTGTVSGITKSMVGLGSVDNTSDANKPISTATQTALDLKAPLANPTFTGTVSGITKNMVGLGSVDNTSDANKPISTAQQAAIDTKTGFFTVAQIRAFSAGNVTANPRIFTTDAGKEGEWRYNAGSSATDNTGMVLVTASGARYERVVKDNVYRSDWFKITGDAHGGLAVRRAVNAALTALTVDSNAVVTIGKGRTTIDTTYILLAVPKWKKLVIQGEPGNILDFYAPESGGIFRTNPSAFESDSTYNFGVVELVGLNFYGGRNPVGTYLSESYGVRPIWLVNAQGVKIKDCSFRNIYGSGLAVGWSRTVSIEGNTFENVYARQPNTFGPGGIYGDATGDAISVYARGKNISISNNLIQLQNGLTGRCGISVDDKCKNFVVNGNVIQGYERGIHIEHCQNGVVNANIITRSPIAGLSGINRAVIWSNNIFDSEKQVSVGVLGSPAGFLVLFDTLCVYRGNIVRNWSGVSGTNLARFWGNDLLIENNIFEPNKANAEVWGYGYNYRNTYKNNEFRGKTTLRIDYNYFPTVSDNTFWGGTIQGHYSEDAIIENNRLRPDVGSNTGQGLLMYAMVRPVVSRNVVISAASYVIENTGSTDGLFEENTHFRRHSSATTSFFVDTAIPATGVKKTAPDRYNIIRDYITPNTLYVGNTGTPIAY